MAANSYIVLTTSDGSLSKRYRVLASGYNEFLQKVGSIERTADGGLDITTGGIYDIREYSIRVRHTEEDSNYGTLYNLRDVFLLNDPMASPSNILTLKDHYYDISESVAMSVVLQGDLQKQIIGYALDGVNSWFIIKLRLLVIPAKRLLPADASMAFLFDIPRLVVDLVPSDAACALSFDEPVLENVA